MATKKPRFVQNTAVTPPAEAPKKMNISFAAYQEDYVSPRNWEIPWLAGDGGFISWDSTNLFPQFLLTLYDNSPTHGSIINGKTTHITGKDLIVEGKDAEKATAFITKCNRKGDSLMDVWRRIVLDYVIFGGFALKVIWNKQRNKVVEVYYVDISKYRFNIKGDRLKFSAHWDQWAVYNQQTLAANKSNFNINAIEEYLYSTDSDDIKASGGEQIFYYSGITSRSLYPRPSYMQGINPIITDIENANYHRANIQGGMHSSITVQTFTGLPADDEKEKGEKAFLEKFTGTDNANGVIFIYNEPNQEPAKIEAIPDNGSDARFLVQSKETKSNIYNIHGCSGAVFGQETEGKLGDNQQLKVAYDNFKKSIVEPAQNELLGVLNKLLTNTLKNAEIKIKAIPSLLNYFTVDRIKAAAMTPLEVRQLNLEDGLIDTVDYIGELMGDKNIPNLNVSDNALAAKNNAQAEATTNPVPDNGEEPETDSTTTN